MDDFELSIVGQPRGFFWFCIFGPRGTMDLDDAEAKWPGIEEFCETLGGMASNEFASKEQIDAVIKLTGLKPIYPKG